MFEALSTYDQRHLIAVHHSAKRVTQDDGLLLAALLHDIGKATLSGARVSLVARVFQVLRNAAPGPVRERVRPPRDGAWLKGSWLAEHHAAIGAERLRALGVDEAICQMVQLHDARDVNDQRLALLHRIDSTTL